MSAVQTSSVTNTSKTQRLALGTVQFGVPYGLANKLGQVSPAVAEQMVRLAVDSGVDTIDTAIGYGVSEQVLGKIGVGNFKVVSKLLPLPESVKNVDAWVLREIEASLARLNLDGLYGLLLHRSSDLHGAQGVALYAAMQKLKTEGRVKKIGISIYSPSELDACFGKFELDLIQAPFNLVDHRLCTSGWLERLKANGCEVHVRSVFLQGLLLMPRPAIPVKFGQWDCIWNTWHQWLQQHNADAVAACLAYPLSFPQIDRVVVGANDLEQLQQIMVAAGRRIQQPLPDLVCNEECLINPAKWSDLQVQETT
jgi:aryl-alcohol dehydrogenase-like predicted oxidoreductase